MGGRTGERAAVPLAGQVRDIGLGPGRLKTGHAAAARRPDDRLGAARGAAERCRRLDDVGARRRRAPAAAALRDRADQRATRMTSSARVSTARPCSPARSRGADRAIARRSRTRCGASATATATRFSSSPRGSIPLWSIPTASRPRFRPIVQREFVRSIAGLERCEIVRPGYAVEYEYVDPRRLELDAREAAMSAGCSSPARSTARPAMRRRRRRGWSPGSTRPRRRSTWRQVRFDRRIELHRRDDRRSDAPGRQRALSDDDRARRISAALRADNAVDAARRGRAGGRIALSDRRRRQIIEACISPVAPVRGLGATEEAHADALYAPYIERQRREWDGSRADRGARIPADLDFAAIPGLSTEMVERLSARPGNASTRRRGSRGDARGAVGALCRASGARRHDRSLGRGLRPPCFT